MPKRLSALLFSAYFSSWIINCHDLGRNLDLFRVNMSIFILEKSGCHWILLLIGCQSVEKMFTEIFEFGIGSNHDDHTLMERCSEGYPLFWNRGYVVWICYSSIDRKNNGSLNGWMDGWSSDRVEGMEIWPEGKSRLESSHTDDDDEGSALMIIIIMLIFMQRWRWWLGGEGERFNNLKIIPNDRMRRESIWLHSLSPSDDHLLRIVS